MFIKKFNIFIVFLLHTFLLSNTLFPQEVAPAVSDSSRTKKIVKKAEIKGPISYEAQNIDNLVKEQKTILSGRAKVSYQDMTLTAAKITVDWENDLMKAEGVLDTVWVKKESGDSAEVVQLQGAPEFSEAGDVMRGEVMLYNFHTRKGRVLRGRTAFEDGFYFGKALKIVKPRTLNVAGAQYTTCDKEDDPHFHFWSNKMKICINDKVVAKPLVMFIGRIPVLALPFIYFPIQKGRQSGIIFPRYGESTFEGRYLRGLGYYWAASEYWDVKGMVDFFEKSGFLFRGDLRYAVRYKLNGSISGSWTRKDFKVSGLKDRRWDMAVSHSQTISPTTQLSVSGRFVSSGSFYRDLSANREHRLQQEIRSNATLTKRLSGSRSITVNLNQTRNLRTDEITETLPRINFRAGQFAIIPKPKGRKGEEVPSRWYHLFYISYSSKFLREGNKRLSSVDSVFIKKRNAGWDHSLQFSSSQKLFGWLNLNPMLNYRETWFDKRKDYFINPETGGIESVENEGFFARRTFYVSASFGTKIYGLFRPRFLKDFMLRHVATPSISFTFQPDFSQDRWGYYQTVTDSQGVVYEKDRYSGSIFGATSSGGEKTINFGLNNLFQMKIGEGENEKKFDLFTWSLSTSYNWKAVQYRLSDLRSSIRANPLRILSINFNATHSFYQVDEVGNRVNRLLIDEINWKELGSIFSKPWVRLTNFSGSLDLRLKGRARAGASSEREVEYGLTETTVGIENLNNLPGDRFDMDEEVTGFDIPWNLSATLNYNESRYNPLNPSKQFWARTNLEFNLTKNWKVSYRAQFDLVEKDVVSQDFVFYRDLHCWEARIVWTPTGYNKRFYFRINVKSPMLRDIKFEKGAGRRGIYGY